MALNWKIKLTKKTLIYGNETGNSLDDLDKIATALGITKDQCHEQITSIKVKKIDIWSAENIDAIQFTYSIDTKDKTGVEVLGNKHGGSTGTLQTWTFASDWLVRVNGKRGDYTTQGYYNIIRWLQFKSFYVNETNHDTWQGEKGTNAGTDFSMIAPACFFSRGGNLVYAFGCYTGELYNADAKIASDNLKTWTETFKPKTADQIKKDLEAGTTATTNLSKWTGAFPNLTAEQVLTKYNEPKEIHTDYDKIKGDLKAWTDTFPLPLTPDTVKTKYEEPKEAHTEADLKPKDYEEKITELNKWTSTFPASKFKDGAESVSATIINLEGSKTNLDALTTYWNDNISKDYELPVFGTDALIDLKEHLKGLLQKSQDLNDFWKQNGFNDYGTKIDKDSLKNVKDKLTELTNNQEKHTADQLEKHTADQLKPDDYDKNINELNDWRANFPNKKPSEAKQEASQQGNQAGQSTQYLNKLLEIYKAQIKQETQAFYLNKLGLDESDDIRPKYNGVEYLTLLDKLNGDSEPEQVINAFKIVALIVMTEQAQSESDEWVDPATNTIQSKYNAVRYKKLKQNKINYFNKVKDFWDANAELTTTENNNPLYLPIITQKQDYITKINNILKIWQA